MVSLEEDFDHRGDDEEIRRYDVQGHNFCRCYCWVCHNRSCYWVCGFCWALLLHWDLLVLSRSFLLIGFWITTTVADGLIWWVQYSDTTRSATMHQWYVEQLTSSLSKSRVVWDLSRSIVSLLTALSRRDFVLVIELENDVVCLKRSVSKRCSR